MMATAVAELNHCKYSRGGHCCAFIYFSFHKYSTKGVLSRMMATSVAELNHCKYSRGGHCCAFIYFSFHKDSTKGVFSRMMDDGVAERNHLLQIGVRRLVAMLTLILNSALKIR